TSSRSKTAVLRQTQTGTPLWAERLTRHCSGPGARCALPAAECPVVRPIERVRGGPEMPVTISYDFKNSKPNDRTYIRSMLERFGWQRLGGSVFRYPHSAASDTAVGEDWLNAVVP